MEICLLDSDLKAKDSVHLPWLSLIHIQTLVRSLTPYNRTVSWLASSKWASSVKKLQVNSMLSIEVNLSTMAWWISWLVMLLLVLNLLLKMQLRDGDKLLDLLTLKLLKAKTQTLFVLFSELTIKEMQYMEVIQALLGNVRLTISSLLMLDTQLTLLVLHAAL